VFNCRDVPFDSLLREICTFEMWLSASARWVVVPSQYTKLGYYWAENQCFHYWLCLHTSRLLVKCYGWISKIFYYIYLYETSTHKFFALQNNSSHIQFLLSPQWNSKIKSFESSGMYTATHRSKTPKNMCTACGMNVCCLQLATLPPSFTHWQSPSTLHCDEINNGGDK
jgi:hypothetical protein